MAHTPEILSPLLSTEEPERREQAWSEFRFSRTTSTFAVTDRDAEGGRLRGIGDP